VELAHVPGADEGEFYCLAHSGSPFSMKVRLNME
jgi:hypothetical protein